ncbi:MAG: transporter substrate-binding domain-containing protein [Magnetococcales bacterium]|nr:transporter substrate-binding domain-containing protein [Magnetococcales bacterium]
MRKFRTTMGLFLSLLHVFSAAQADPRKIDLLTYHNHPPFVTEQAQGLSYELLNLLNQQAPDRFLFELRILPRNRLNVQLADWLQGRCAKEKQPACHEDWGVLWVNPAWGFSAGPEKRFLWIPMVKDSNAIISRRQDPVPYNGPESLFGKRLGGIRGHTYLGIDTAVQANKITRLDGDSERDNVLKLVKHRVDVILMPSSTIHYFLTQDAELTPLASELYIAANKHQSFIRHTMLPPGQKELEQLFKTLQEEGAWQKIMRQYGF